MQMMYFIQSRKPSDARLRDIEIIFATPVYATDTVLLELYDTESKMEQECRLLLQQRNQARADAKRVWKSKPPMGNERILETTVRDGIKEFRRRVLIIPDEHTEVLPTVYVYTCVRIYNTCSV